MQFRKINGDQRDRYAYEVLSNAKIQAIYFGGGTASLMNVDVMKRIFDAIPNFKEIKNKAIEFHPSTLSAEKVQTIIDYKFSFVSIGIQTFDEEMLKSVNRNKVDVEKDAVIDITSYVGFQK